MTSAENVFCSPQDHTRHTGQALLAFSNPQTQRRLHTRPDEARPAAEPDCIVHSVNLTSVQRGRGAQFSRPLRLKGRKLLTLMESNACAHGNGVFSVLVC